MEKKLGKIKIVRFGYGGYQDAQMGISFVLGGKGWGVSDFKGWWSQRITVDEHTKWSESDRDRIFAETVRLINKLLDDAHVKDIEELEDTPIEATFDNNTLQSWRILTEVI